MIEQIETLLVNARRKVASKYILYMPDKEQLIAQVEHVVEDWHKKK